MIKKESCPYFCMTDVYKIYGVVCADLISVSVWVIAPWPLNMDLIFFRYVCLLMIQIMVTNKEQMWPQSL